MIVPPVFVRPRDLLPFAPLALTTGVLFWVFWPTFVDLAQTYQSNPQYSHGFLVPFFALVLLWLRREHLAVNELQPNRWGLALLGAGLLIRLIGAFFFFVWLDPISLIPCVAGLVLLLGGRAAWRWSWPAVLFLTFMVPLPYRVATSLAGPLQRLATITSSFVMQVIGLPALAEGNVIYIGEHQIGIVEACSGLRMLVVFFALATAVVLVVRRHWIDKTLIIASAIPIALISNIFRVTVTGVMHNFGYSEMANAFFHDVAGWLMMPMALGMLWVELKVLSDLFIDAPEQTKRPTVPVAPSQRKKTTIARPTASQSPTPRKSGQRPAGKRRPVSAPPRNKRQTEVKEPRQREQAPASETPVEQVEQS